MIDSDDLLALAAAVHVHIKLHSSPQQRYPRSLTEITTTFAALLVRRQPDDVPELHNVYTIQRIQDVETAGLGANNPHTQWLASTIGGVRCGNNYRRILNRLQLVARADSLAFLANQLAATHFRDVPSSVTSTASQIGIAAWADSALLWWRFCSFTQRS